MMLLQFVSALAPYGTLYLEQSWQAAYLSVTAMICKVSPIAA